MRNILIYHECIDLLFQVRFIYGKYLQVHIRKWRSAATVYARIGQAFVNVTVTHETIIAGSTLTLPQIGRRLYTCAIATRIRQTNVDLSLAAIARVASGTITIVDQTAL